MRIDPLSAKNPALDKLAQAASSATADVKAPGKGGDDFGHMLMDALKEVNESQQTAAAKQDSFMAGQQVDYHDLMIAVEKASTSMQLTMALRNKVLEAYSEISHMQI